MNPRVKVEVSHTGKVVYSSTFTDFPILIGRSAECQVQLDKFGFISRVHGSIALEKDELVITDLGSKNGIISEGQKVFSARNSELLSFKIEDLSVKVEFEQKGELEQDETEITVIKTQIRRLVQEGLDPSPSKHSDAPSVHDSIKFSLAPFPGIKDIPESERVLQAVVTWDDDVYDVQNFFTDDRISISSSNEVSTYLPDMKDLKVSGTYTQNGATIKVVEGGDWALYTNREQVSLSSLTTLNKVFRKDRFLFIKLGAEDVLSQKLSEELIVHYRFVKAPAYRMPRTWIENKEDFKKAAFVSLGVHLALMFLAISSVPKSTVPRIPNVPPRIAQLLVEPPSQVLASKPQPPPPPPPEPEPEPEPIPEPPPTPQVQKPKLKPVEPPKVIPKEKPKVVQKAPPRVQPTAKAVAKERAPEPKEPEVQAPNSQEIANLLKTLPGPPSGGSPTKGAPIRIAQKDISAKGVSVAGIAASSSLGSPSSGTAQESFNLAQGGAEGYAKTQGGKAGKRNVGAKVIGTPSLEPDLSREQGLTNEQVMAVVNKQLGGVQRCYERALFDDGSLSGRVEYEWEISSTGKVTDIKVTRSQIARADTLNNCVFELFRKMQFPTAKNGQTTIAKIGFPFGK